MKYGIVKVAAVTPTVKVNDPTANAKTLVSMLGGLKADGVEIAVFPELCISGYTAADLFLTKKLLDGVLKAVNTVAEATPDGMIVFFGAPIALGGRLYNCAVATSNGKLLGINIKTELPDYSEFYEKRYFTPAFDGVVIHDKLNVPMGNVLYKCSNFPELVVGCEICEDMWTDKPPAVDMCRAGATVIANLSASDEVVGKAEYRKLLVASASGRMRCGYIYADTGLGESTTDVVFSGHNIIAENGSVIAESAPFGSGVAVTELDIERLDVERRRQGLKPTDKVYKTVEFALVEKDVKPTALVRTIDKYPFVPSGAERGSRAELILTMQSRALKSRFDAINSKTAVIGVSGGLDSALALLVCNRALKSKDIVAVTMPCFGTTDKTKNNAAALCDALGIKMLTVDIKDTVTKHLADIDHDKRDVVYENAQARTRTMTLFDIANKTGGLVIGTGDLSELALGWATYNGDHMSSYGVNAGVPKTLVKYLVRYEADRLGGNAKLALDGILSTEISPELLPPTDGKITQKTEDILGEYDLHDFIMYYYCRFGFTREKIKFLMLSAFGESKKADIEKALDIFFKRFFANQFKRSCLPDGVKIGSVSFSPRSDWRMPSDVKE